MKNIHKIYHIISSHNTSFQRIFGKNKLFYSFITNLKPEFLRNEPILSKADVNDLFQAKCRDLNIEKDELLKNRFHLYCKNNCSNRKFNFSNIGIKDHAIDILKKILHNNTNIFELDLSKNGLNYSMLIPLITPISNSVTLGVLNLSSNNINDKGFEKLFNSISFSQSIIRLDISNYEGNFRNRISNRGINALSNFLKINKILSFLSIKSILLRLEGLYILSLGLIGNEALLYLNIEFNEIFNGDKSYETFYNLTQATKLEDIDLTGNTIGVYALEAISDSITFLSCSLKKLHLGENKIEGKQIDKLFKNIKKNSNIEYISLQKNKFSMIDKQSIEHLLSNNFLKILNLSGTKIADRGCIPIIKGLQINSSIEVLLLSNNLITCMSIKLLSNLIGIPSISLKHLDLSWNLIGNEGGESLIQFIKYNSNMASLNINNNRMNNRIGFYLIEACKVNKSIVSIKANFNSISLRYIEEINLICLENMHSVRKEKLNQFKHMINQFKIDPFEISKIIEETQKVKSEIEGNTIIKEALEKKMVSIKKERSEYSGKNEQSQFTLPKNKYNLDLNINLNFNINTKMKNKIQNKNQNKNINKNNNNNKNTRQTQSKPQNQNHIKNQNQNQNQNEKIIQNQIEQIDQMSELIATIDSSIFENDKKLMQDENKIYHLISNLDSTIQELNTSIIKINNKINTVKKEQDQIIQKLNQELQLSRDKEKNVKEQILQLQKQVQRQVQKQVQKSTEKFNDFRNNLIDDSTPKLKLDEQDGKHLIKLSIQIANYEIVKQIEGKKSPIKKANTNSHIRKIKNKTIKK